ncbi:unnamed protein product [Rhizoctonia solani]|uniref:Uncharacterized protein n=1 Tax=Rhizoctonia solani TaxID=456999 RepID=A0A8H3DBH5_9AGAM|nr:unnamed protein product [Rhizoctonia solani]
MPDVPETPRITDDVWPLLWSRHLHTDDASLPLGLPVAGRVQFDVDIPSARWYPMWFAHVSRKELVPDLARAIPTSPRSPRGANSTPVDSARAQKVPRPLALVPRQEPMPEVQIDLGPSPIPSPSKPATPPVASKETVEKVRRWSALVTPEPATLHPSPPADSATILPTDDSNTHPTESTTVEEAEIVPEPLNLEDFQWSVTSAGPPSPASSCATTTSSRAPSIHVLERVEGSVILTPTTATSWGPRYDSDIESELDPEPEWRVRSPDVGERAEGSVLLTPSTATSWGAPLSYPPTPAQWAAMHELVRSPDLGERAEGSVLLTPSTATTWGAPSSYPPTPAEWRALTDHIVHSPDLGRRAEGSVLLTPSTATTWGPPSAYPDTPEIARPREWAHSPGLGDREELTPGRAGRMSMMNWGAEVETEEEAYARMGLGWPEGSLLPEVPEEVEEQDEDGSESDYEQEESLDDLQLVSVQHAVRSVRNSVIVHVSQEVHYDDTPSVAGSNDDVESLYDGHTFGRESEPERAFEIELELESPQLGIVTEEHHDAIVVESGHIQEIHASRGLVVESYNFESEAAHGRVEIEFDEELEIIPDSARVASSSRASPDSIEGDVFEYAFSDSRAEPAFPVSVSTSEFPLSPAIDFDSPMMHSFVSETPAEAITVAANTTIATTSATTSLTTQSLVSTRSYGAYPYLVIYPAVYPHLDLYPIAPATNLSRPELGLSTQSRHPPSPPIADSPVNSVRSPASSRKSSLSIQVPSNRARSRSIVAVNPANKRSLDWSRSLPPVPPVPRALRDSVGSIRSFSKKGSGSSLGSVREAHTEEPVVAEERGHTEDKFLPSQNPRPQPSSTVYPYRYPENLEQLYPSKDTAWYPTNLEHIYPVLSEKTRTTSSVAARSVGAKPLTSNNSPATYSTQAYPVFNLYPAVYPHNLGEIYPAVPYGLSVLSVPPRVSAPAKSLPVQRAQNAEVSRGYPFIDLYPAVYPHNLEEIYPALPRHSFVPTALTSTVAPVLSAPPRVPTPAKSLSVQRTENPEISRGYPFIDLYPAVYPHNLEEIYPALPHGSSVLSVPPRVSASAKSLPVQRAENAGVSRGYPFFDLYPAVYPHNLEEIYPALLHRSFAPANSSSVQRTQNVEISRGYPFIDLYPAVYPHNLAHIYPSVLGVVIPTPAFAQVARAQSLSAPRETDVSSVPAPDLDGYPFNLDKLYPAISGHPKLSSSTPGVAVSPIAPVPKSEAPTMESTRLARVYPNFELYRPVYPYNLAIYPPIRVTNELETVQAAEDKVVRNSPVSDEDLGDAQTKTLPKRMRKTHAQLCTEAWRKTHAQLVTEVLASRPRKLHAELEAEVFPNGLPEAKIAPEVEPPTPTLSVTEAHGEEAGPATKPVLEKLAPVPVSTTGPKSAPVPAVAALRRQRSGTIMRPSPTESLPPPLPQGAGIELGRSRSMVEARTQMFERTHTRSQTGPQVPPARTLVRQKSATFERAKSLFHTPEETKSEGSQTPPLRSVPMRRVTKLDISKFGFA